MRWKNQLTISILVISSSPSSRRFSDSLISTGLGASRVVRIVNQTSFLICSELPDIHDFNLCRKRKRRLLS